VFTKLHQVANFYDAIIDIEGQLLSNSFARSVIEQMDQQIRSLEHMSVRAIVK